MRVSGTWNVTIHRLTAQCEWEVTTSQNQAHRVRKFAEIGVNRAPVSRSGMMSTSHFMCRHGLLARTYGMGVNFFPIGFTKSGKLNS